MLLGLLLSPLSPAGADAATTPTPSARQDVGALSIAARVLAGDALPGDPPATVALRDLWLARPDLTGADTDAAAALLARPTDGTQDPYANGYTVPSSRECGTHVCVHYVPTTLDAPPSPQWVNRTLATMEQTYDREVTQLGYRRPRPDGSLGGDNRLDVYLKDLGSGLYGYCAAEHPKKARTASGFCVLDNDYAPAQYPGATTPRNNLAVTAAHEFFHTVQYSYDFDEDPWMLESTATWMEEQVADDINDNRQYLRYSQLASPYVPLDAVSSTYGFQYGNWVFWEYLTQRFGAKIVKRAWQEAGSLRGDGGRYSVQAVEKVLAKKGGLTSVYADFAAANTVPGHSYEEAPGVAEYADPAPLADVTLDRTTATHRQVARIDHLSSEFIRVRPGADLTGRRWRLQVAVRGPRRGLGPAARVLIHHSDDTIRVRRLRFTKSGRASVVIPFSLAKVSAVTVSVANVSTRFRCGLKTDSTCRGKARDDKQKFSVIAKATKSRDR